MWRRTFKTVLLLLIVAAIVRTWLLQGLLRPQRIAGPSMSETALGPHRSVTCHDCGWKFPCAESLLHRSGLATCPLCGEADNDWTQLPTSVGERLLIDRAAFLLRSPRRWETVVFRCNNPPGAYCIKRVVGLPGEQIELRDGEVYVDGTIARKPLAIARSMNLTVHDSRYRPTKRKPVRGWVAEDSAKIGESSWKTTNGSFRHAPIEPTKRPGGQAGDNDRGLANVDWLAYYHHMRAATSEPDAAPRLDLSQAVSDNYGVNQDVSRQLNRVPDVLATADVEVRGQGSLWLRVARAGEHYHFQVNLSRNHVTLSSGSETVAAAQINAAELESARIEWGSLDRQLLLAIDDRIVLRHALDKGQSASTRTRDSKLEKTTPDSPLAIGTDSLDVNIQQLRVWRDVYYTPAPVGYSPAYAESPYQVGPTGYFVLGDNSPMSLDSRVEQPRPERADGRPTITAPSATGQVDADALIGRPIFFD